VLRETKVPVHFSVSFVFAPGPVLNQPQLLAFQGKAGSPPAGIYFDQVQHQTNQAMLVRAKPPLQVGLASMPQGIGQLTVAAERPDDQLEDFVVTADAVIAAYRDVWGSQIQVIRRDCSIRSLFAVPDDHVFRYLWEKRLGQAEESIKTFGRPILGGGLRFVMPGQPNVVDDPLLEVKVESFFENPKQLFVDTHATWATPLSPGAQLLPRDLLRYVSEYADGPVLDFIVLEN
jgi:hypothetical protein